MLFGASRRLRELENRLGMLELKLSELERMVKNRDVDWEEMRARCKRLLDRTVHEARAIDQETPENDAPILPKNLPAATIMPTGDRMAKIQRQLAERGRKVS